MNFYEALKRYRKQKGLTIRELAERSGVSTAYISQLEHGNRGIPSPEVLNKLSEGLNMSYSELMKVAGYLEPRQDLTQIEHSEPINLRRFIRENPLIFDGVELSNEDKEWMERVLTALFWKRRHGSS